MSTNNNALREWAEISGISIGTADGGPYPTIEQLAQFAALAASKPETTGINGLTYDEESATASVMGLTRKPEPQAQLNGPTGVSGTDHAHQAQAAETEVPPRGYCWDTDDMCFRSSFGLLAPPDFHEKWFSKRHVFPTFRERIELGTVFPVEPLCSLKEAIAKKDAALDACVEALKKLAGYNQAIKDGIINYRPDDHIAVADAAITKAQEARK